MTFFRLTLALFTLLGTHTFAQTQSFRIGAVLSQSGNARAHGQAQAEALTLQSAQRLERRLGQPLELLMRDDGSSPERALREVRRLVEEEGVHAVICCTSAASVRSVRDYVNEARILTLSLSAPPESPGPWLFSLRPDEMRLLQGVILAQADVGKVRFGLLALESYAAHLRAALDALISPESGVYLVVDERYSPSAQALTPEALWVATRLPDTVFLWGLSGDTRLGYRALRERGYEGDVVVNPALLEQAGTVTSLEGALVPVGPAALGPALPRTHPNFEAALAYRQQMARRYGAVVPPDGAYAHDAFTLLVLALEQSASYGVSAQDLRVFRGVLRDALVGMGPFNGASGSYDYREGDAVGLLPRSLALARVGRGGWLEPAP